MKYAPPTLDIARQQITALLELYEKATGFRRTFVIILATAGAPTRGDAEAKGNPKFGSGYLKTDFGHSTYDRLNSRLSALWPEKAEWPADIPRQKPAKIEKATLSKIAAKLHDRGGIVAPPAGGAWPAGQHWPDDIPLPASMR